MTDSTFDDLFAACWKGDSAWEVLADYVLEHPELLPLSTSFLYCNCDGPPPAWVHHSVCVPAGKPNVIEAYVLEKSWGVQSRRHFPLTEFAANFPDWLAGQRDDIERLAKYGE